MNKGSSNEGTSRVSCDESSRNTNTKREQASCEGANVTPVLEVTSVTTTETRQTTVNVATIYQGHSNLGGSSDNTVTPSPSTSYRHGGGSSGTGEGDGITVTAYHHNATSSTDGAPDTRTSYHQTEVGVAGSSTEAGVGVMANIPPAYHLSHGGGGIVAGNGGSGGQVNATPSYYYSPILNSQQSLLRPIMTAQPPLYSPLLASQQHSYPMPHSSPSAGSSYFANLSETMRGGLPDMLPSTSESVYKDVGQGGRQGSGTGHSSKTCDASDHRQYAMEVCQRRLQQDGGYNAMVYPSCGEVSRSNHDQRTFEDYSRMVVYGGEDGTSRGWDSMGGCSTSSTPSASRLTGPPSHMTHPYTYSFTDCRLDATWNKCVAGMGVGAMGGAGGVNGEGFTSQEQQLEASQIKGVPRGPPSHTLPVNVNMGMSSMDPSISRSHYEYQPLPGTQIPPFLPYLTPLNYQQMSEPRTDARPDHRIHTHRPQPQDCGGEVSQCTSRDLEHHLPASGKLPVASSTQASVTVPHPGPPSSQPSASLPPSQSTTTLPHTQPSTSQTPAATSSQPSTSVHLHPDTTTHSDCQSKNVSALVEGCSHSGYKKKSCSGESVCRACVDCEGVVARGEGGAGAEVQQQQQQGVSEAAASTLSCSSQVISLAKVNTSCKKKVRSESDEGSNVRGEVCLLCDSPISTHNSTQPDSTFAACSMDSLSTVVSKVSVGDKLGGVVGVVLPRHLLHSTTICSKCFHLVNEFDLLEHRLSLYRKYIMTKIEGNCEKHGIRIPTLQKIQQQQQQLQQQQHQLQHQHQHQQHHHQQQHQQQQQQQGAAPPQHQHQGGTLQQHQQHQAVQYQTTQLHQQLLQHHILQQQQQQQQQQDDLPHHHASHHLTNIQHYMPTMVQQLHQQQHHQTHHNQQHQHHHHHHHNHHQQQQQQHQQQKQQIQQQQQATQQPPQQHSQAQQQQPQSQKQQQPHPQEQQHQHIQQQSLQHQQLPRHTQQQPQQQQCQQPIEHQVISVKQQHTPAPVKIMSQPISQLESQHNHQSLSKPVSQLETIQTHQSVSKPPTNDNNMVFVDCEIDIEDCECNLIGESQVEIKNTLSEEEGKDSQGSSKTVKVSASVTVASQNDTCASTSTCLDTLMSEVRQSKEQDVSKKQQQGLENDVVSEPGSTQEQPVCTEEKPSVSTAVEGSSKDVCEGSPVVSSSGLEEESRKEEDATEYHKPTLLVRNIKAKKHAKLQICRQCDQVFSNRQALVRHIERRHKAYAFHFSCDTCRKKFSSERALRRHVQLHKTYLCKLCDNIFLRKSKLKKHVQDHMQESLACKICTKECSSVQALLSHMKTHTAKKKLFKCNTCSKTFANNRNLEAHYRTHTGEKPFKCDNCGRGFSHRSNMQVHHDSCTGQFSHKCQICGRGFALESVYQCHLAMHKGQYDHCCSICGRGFMKVSGLLAHVVTHNRQRPVYTCELCGKTLSTASSYNSHMNSHSGEGSVMCNVCGKTLARRSDLQDHLNRHNGIKSHTCTICSTAFYYRSNLHYHINSAHRLLRPYSCTLCDKSFSSKYKYKLHIRTHTGERPHQCKSCGKSFTNKSNYNRHLKCHVTQVMSPLSVDTEP